MKFFKTRTRLVIEDLAGAIVATYILLIIFLSGFIVGMVL